MRGCRTTKVNAAGFDAFDSPNLPPLAEIGIDMKLQESLTGEMLQTAPSGLRVREIKDPRVAELRLFPGISAQLLDNILQARLKGLVLELYGTGNGPGGEAYLKVLAEATQRQIILVAVTQCLEGTVDLMKYAAGSPYAEAGVISGFDMTSEAAATKLSYLLSIEPRLSFEEVRRLMQRHLRGELTVPGNSGPAESSS